MKSFLTFRTGNAWVHIGAFHAANSQGELSESFNVFGRLEQPLLFLGHLGCGREWQSHPPCNEVIGAVDHAQLRKFRVEFLSQAICGPSCIQDDGSLQKGGPAVWLSDNLVTVEEFDGDAATRTATRIWSAIERMEWSVAISR